MDNRRLVIGMLIAMAIVFLWHPAFLWVYQQLGYKLPEPPAQVDSTTRPSTTQSSRDGLASTQALPTTGAVSATQAVAPAISAAPPAAVRIAPATRPASAVELGSSAANDPTYRMSLSIDPRGAGLNGVVLNEFKRTAESDERYVFQLPYTAQETETRPLATRSVTVNGITTDLLGVNWELEHADSEHATYGVTLAGDAGPIVRVRKSYQLLPESDPSQGYEVLISHTFTNLTDQPLSVRTSFNGPALPPKEQDRGGDRQTLAGFTTAGHITVGHDMIESFTKDKPTREYTKNEDGNPMMWSGSGSIYFLAIARPLPLEEASNSPPQYIEKVTATLVSSPETKPADHEIITTFTTTELTVAPGQELALPVRTFFGPKQRKLLNTDYYSSFPVAYDHTLVLAQGFCGICTFQWLINLLVTLLRGFHWVFGGFAGSGDWGLAIIALVVLVRAILHPITKRSQISMSRMSKMGPEMERLKKKYGDNKEELNKAMMQFYKEQGIAPVLGCLPMFLQMPIWIALWQSLQTTFELRQAPFLWGFTWIHDLSKPDHLITWDPIPLLFGFELSALNILPILMGGVFYLQMKMQPKPAAMTKEQEQQQKMMQWMTLLFPLMLYTGPSGLNLYILTSTAIGIVESKIVRDHIRQQEEAEKSGQIIVDAGKKFRGGGGAGGAGAAPKKTPPERPKGGLMGWIADLQAKADNVRREGDKRGGR